MELEIILQTHKMLAHRSAVAVADRLRKSVYFPNLLKRCTEVLATCRRCIVKTKPSSVGQKHTHMPHVTGYPFQKLSVDFVGPRTV